MPILKLYGIQVRRDAHTITPVTVPEHEVSILQSVFGEENVQNLRGETIEATGLDVANVVGEREFVDEFERLASKYGSDEKGELIVETVFGKKAGKGLDRAMADAAEKEVKFPKPKAEAVAKDPADPKGTKGASKTKPVDVDKDPADPTDPTDPTGK
jgi:hypothetical protein